MLIKSADIISWVGGPVRVEAGYVTENVGTRSAGSEFRVTGLRNKPPRAIPTLKGRPCHCRGQEKGVIRDQT